jgi:hypothetical protein
MNLSITTTRRLAKAIAVALGVVAMAVPAAQATVQPAGNVPLDPWAYNVTHRSAPSVELITEHSAGQNGTGLRSAVPSSSAATSLEATGFSWRDAGIGAAGALTLLLVVGGAMLALRKRSALAHVHT